MTKEQLSKLPDDVRLPAEILFERLGEIGLKPANTAVTDDGGLALFFEAAVDDLKLTADIEIEADGTVSASVIPYIAGDEGHEIFQSESEPIDLWEIEEPPPFEETLSIIKTRLKIA